MESVTQIIKKVRVQGYASVKEWAPLLSTEEIALRFGNPLDVAKLLPNTGIGKVQTLRPKKTSVELMNQYSGSYGLGEFPLHSDLAHWQIPPRYLVLRCIVGAKGVFTNVLPYTKIRSHIGDKILNFALVVPRRKSNLQTICPMPIHFKKNNEYGMRWDSLFLKPINIAGYEVFEKMASIPWDGKGITSLCLENTGDTLIIDNWKMLHSRSAIPKSSENREIERIYINDIGINEYV